MIDIHKKYTTKDDKEVRIYATDGIGLYPIHGAVLNYAGSTNDQGWSVGTWTNDGLYDIAAPNSSLNLVEVWVPKDKEPVWCWDKRDTAGRVLRFWDAKNNRGFQVSGKRRGVIWDNYAKVENVEQWMLDIQAKLED